METDADPQSRIRWSLANHAEERDKEEPEVSIISQENPGKQLTCTDKFTESKSRTRKLAWDQSRPSLYR